MLVLVSCSASTAEPTPCTPFTLVTFQFASPDALAPGLYTLSANDETCELEVLPNAWPPSGRCTAGASLSVGSTQPCTPLATGDARGGDCTTRPRDSLTYLSFRGAAEELRYELRRDAVLLQAGAVSLGACSECRCGLGVVDVSAK